MTTETIHETVRDHYAAAASAHHQGERLAARSPRRSARSSTRRSSATSCPMPPSSPRSGCGNPIAVADLHPGERVLDLGSGGGIDVLLSAKRVGPTGGPSAST